MSHPTKPPDEHLSESEHLLPADLLWAAGGHASDIVLTALADGQHAIVPADVLLHVERCTVCTTHLGHAALLSMHVGAELSTAAAVGTEREAAVRRPIPWTAVAGGLAIAALGSIPTFIDSPVSLSDVVAHDVSLVVRNANALVRTVEPGSPAGLTLTYGTALLLVAVGLVVARTVSKQQKEASR